MLNFNTKVEANKKADNSKQKGFSLIELMVAVAIIGILAAIAIPNYQAFQRRARQSEARSLLSGLFTAEKAFIAEWGGGTTDLRGMGFYPEGELGYVVGFSTDSIDVSTSTCRGVQPARYNGQTLAVAQRHTAHAQVCDGPGTGVLSGTVTCRNISGFDLTTAATNPITHTSAYPSATTGTPQFTASVANASNLSAPCDGVDFAAIAIANLGVVGAAQRDDVWIINQNKILSNVLSGV